MRGREWLRPIYPTAPNLAIPFRLKRRGVYMLTIYRRHTKKCAHRAEGRKYRRCRCPIWVDGFLAGEEIRESLNLRNWEEAYEKLREWEARRSRPAEPNEDRLTIDEACTKYLDD